MIVEKKIVKKGNTKEKKFYKLLEKICKDFDIEDRDKIINDFMKKL